jgi:hypothetical protein
VGSDVELCSFGAGEFLLAKDASDEIASDGRWLSFCVTDLGTTMLFDKKSFHPHKVLGLMSLADGVAASCPILL